ncbi:unnamed protein product [Chondrus crispus]|uniref:DNA topoisomerase n=1 Tax=Chondrus crispus TaxID=2769 RepID=R7Q6W3_CHOCR|nr:unnamed protein product [Chondrus crispus]CDF34277.1 unnamed protein product [Chondrus crispus]|eukprot:XP_005714096.1 unnamed protein product [Chondrus crispus]
MVLRVLNVAEKPSAAKEIANVLKAGQQCETRPGLSRFNQIYDFDMNLAGNRARMSFTSVLGHLKGTDFEDRVRKWGSCDPVDLLDRSRTKVEWFVPEDKQPIAETLRRESRRADWLVLWLDCDSEGEKIAFDVADVCKQGKPSIVVRRARFSAMTHGDLFRAVAQLGEPNERVAQMVSTRQEIDLRAGSAYTRFLTIQLEKFSLVGDDERQIVSYGPCQFPTLGLVVDRWLKIQNFVRRPFWVFDLFVKDCKVQFDWARKHLFDEYTSMALYELCIEEAEQDGMMVSVTRVDKRMKNRWRPLPLSTVELQKVASRSLRISSHRAMEVAESLYNKGLISYPRTETDRFDKSYNLRDLVGKQVGHLDWGPFASRLLSPPSEEDALAFTWPRSGSNDDGAHPPIHPTDVAPARFESTDHQKIYEYITKRFLAACSIEARASETRVEVRAGTSEFFTARGLIIEEKGYLEVMYPFEKWTDKDMPVALLHVNAKLLIDSLMLRQSQTQPPPLLQESDLIALMDHHGIGTDATIAEHIKKVLDRSYVEKVRGGGFSPTQIGQALVIAHEQCQLHLARPDMRAKQERQLKQILTSEMEPADVLTNALSEYQSKFRHLRQNRDVLDTVFSERFQAVTARTWATLIPQFSRCGACSQLMDLKCSHSSNGGGRGQATSRGHGRGRRRAQAHASVRQEGADRALDCIPCNKTLKVPRNGNLERSQHECPICRYQVISVTNSTSNSTHTVCPMCMNNPPPEPGFNPEGKTSEFRCFNCTNSQCRLARGTPAGLSDVAKCPKCGRPCALRETSSGSRLVSCTAGRGNCDFVYFFPRNSVERLGRANGSCERCGSAVLEVFFSSAARPPGAPQCFKGCIWCDSRYESALRALGEDRDVPRHPNPGSRFGGRRGRGQGYNLRGGGHGFSGVDIEGRGRGGVRGGQHGRGQSGIRFPR